MRSGNRKISHSARPLNTEQHWLSTLGEFSSQRSVCWSAISRGITFLWDILTGWIRSTVLSGIVATFSLIWHHFSLTYQIKSTVMAINRTLLKAKTTKGQHSLNAAGSLTLAAIGAGHAFVSPQRVCGQSCPQRGGPWLWGIWPGELRVWPGLRVDAEAAVYLERSSLPPPPPSSFLLCCLTLPL